MSNEIADIMLNGAQYLLVPGGYERSTDNPASPEPGRLVLSQFENGLGTLFDDSPAKASSAGWSGAGVHAIDNGAGLEPWPAVLSYGDAALVTFPSTTAPALFQAAGDYVFIACDRYLYRTPSLSASTWTGLVLLQTLPAGQRYVDLTYHRDDVLSARGTTPDILRWDTWSMGSATWRAGEHAVLLEGYNGSVLYAKDDNGARELLSIGIQHVNGTALRRSRWLDAPIVQMGAFNGKVAVATRQSLYLIGGQVSDHESSASNASVQWQGDPEPLFTHGAWLDQDAGDLRFLISYLGKLYTWLGGSVVQYSGSGDEGWRRVGPPGRNCYGACVAAGYLVVSMETYDAQSQLWAFDGVGWWCISSQAAPGQVWPVATAGVADFDLMVFNGVSSYRLMRLYPRSATQRSYGTSGSWRSPLLTAGSGDTAKVWRRVAAAFSYPEAPGNAASSDQVTVELDYSLDAGASWTTAASATVGLSRLVDLELTLVPPPVSRLLQLQVRWSSVADWAPVLTDLVVDFATLDSTPRRQQWELKVAVRDQLPGSGRAQIDALWEAWRTAAIVAYRDIDYQNTPVTRNVRILDITEEAPAESLSEAWSGGVVSLLISEV